MIERYFFRLLAYLNENNFDKSLRQYHLIFGQDIVKVNSGTVATDLTEHSAKLYRERNLTSKLLEVILRQIFT